MTDHVAAAIRAGCNNEIPEPLPRCRYPECADACDVAATSLATVRALLPYPTGPLLLDLERIQAVMLELYPEALSMSDGRGELYCQISRKHPSAVRGFCSCGPCRAWRKEK
jgi:hypothetical protein